MKARNIPPKAVGLDKILSSGDAYFARIVDNDNGEAFLAFVDERIRNAENGMKLRRRRPVRRRRQVPLKSTKMSDIRLMEIDGEIVDISEKEDTSSPCSETQ